MKNTEEILEINKRQKEFYNKTRFSGTNIATKMWANFRNGTLSDFRQKFDIKDRVYDEHKLWMGDLKDKKILDLGCLEGNALSLYMAENAKEYVGIDLSDVGIAKLSAKLKQRNLVNASAIAVDFFSADFDHSDFDIVYAYGVLHHFENFDLLISRLKQVMAPNGVIVSYDPLETSTPVKILRAMYRPFQDDKDWEWPFTKKVLKKIDANFTVEKIHGILGKSKYGVLLNLLPLNAKFKSRVIAKMVSDDWNISKIDDLFSCMHVTMMLRKK